mgnify:CR=1 FL=1
MEKSGISDSNSWSMYLVESSHSNKSLADLPVSQDSCSLTLKHPLPHLELKSILPLSVWSVADNLFENGNTNWASSLYAGNCNSVFANSLCFIDSLHSVNAQTCGLDSLNFSLLSTEFNYSQLNEGAILTPKLLGFFPFYNGGRDLFLYWSNSVSYYKEFLILKLLILKSARQERDWQLLSIRPNVFQVSFRVQ